MKLRSVNPYTGKTLQEFEPFPDSQIEKVIGDSSVAFQEWKRTSFELRKQLMLAVSELLKKNAGLYGNLISEEMGKPVTEAKAEAEKCAWVCEYYASEAEIFLHREAVAADTHEAFVLYEPLGTVLGVMPWNFPFWQVFRFAAPTLMAGNVVLLKHASNVQRSAAAIEQIFIEAGFPRGVFQNLVIGSGQVKQVIEHDAVKAVTLTGSENAGSNVAELAGKNIKKSVLELGGNNAFIVLDDADIEKAVEIGAQARLQNAGQSCIAAKRFLVHKNIGDDFVKKFTHEFNHYEVGDPNNEETKIGPLSGLEQAKKVQEQVDRSVEMGAEIVMGGSRDGTKYPPTIVMNVKPGMPLFDEEVFGPVAPIVFFDDLEEAIQLSNNSVFGLGVSLFTNDLERAEHLASEFEEGAVFVNDLVKSDPRLPFGGVKRSGYGRELAMHGIREFVNTKTLYIKKLNDSHKGNKKAYISMGNP